MDFSAAESAKMDTSTPQGRHDFLDLCKDNETEEVKVLVKNNPAYVHAKEAGRHNAVMQATFHGNMDLLKFFAVYNPDYSYTAKDGKTVRDVALEHYQRAPEKNAPRCSSGSRSRRPRPRLSQPSAARTRRMVRTLRRGRHRLAWRIRV